MAEPLLKIKAKGVLFIGDPHVGSRTPGRRLDEDFTSTVCGKLEQAFAIANEHQLYPIILGDLFDSDRDSKPEMLVKLIRSLSTSWIRPLTIIGNHEKTQFFLTDDTALAALREARVIDTLEKAGSRAVLVDDDGVEQAVIGGSPYGQDLPETVAELKKGSSAPWCIWLTHHDLDFQGAYPGATLIREIEGVDMLVNGHMHKTTPPVVKGSMTAFNPGNITRLSIDCRDHEPAVWSWTIGSGAFLKKHLLRFDKEAINMTGYLFEEAAPAGRVEAKAALLLQESLFSKLLSGGGGSSDEKKTDDAQFLKEEIDALHLEKASDDAMKAYILELLDESLRESPSNSS